MGIKEVLMKLQTFSMEVNKSLHDERIKMLSDIDSNILQTDSIQEVMNDTHNITQIQTIDVHANTEEDQDAEHAEDAEEDQDAEHAEDAEDAEDDIQEEDT